MALVLRGIDDVRDGYAAMVRRLVRLAVLSLAADRRSARRGIFGCRSTRRPASCRRKIRAHSSSIVQLPDGASVARTSEVARKVERSLEGMPQMQDTLSDHRLFLAGRRDEAERCASWWRG